jgi:hypothetical protein
MALGEVVVETHTHTLHLTKTESRVIFRFCTFTTPTRVISGVAVQLVGLTGLYSQPVLNHPIIDKGTTQIHRDIKERKRKRLYGILKSLGVLSIRHN